MGPRTTAAAEQPWSPTAAPQLPAHASRLSELLRPTLLRISLLSLFFAYSWLLAVLWHHHPTPYGYGLIAPASLGAAATVALCLSRRYYLASALLSLGLCGAATAELAIAGYLPGVLLSGAAPLVAGLLLGPLGAAATAAGVIAAGQALGLPPAQFLPVAAQVIFSTLLVWVAGGGIVHALGYAEESENRAWRHADLAMRRRGELHTASKQSRDAYALLERTNRELELARREAEEAREIKARFAANISHELRTPLNLIMGFSRLMYRSPQVYGDVRWTPELRADIREVHAASRHLMGMIDDILDLSRVDAQRLPLKLEPTSTASLIQEAAATARGLLRDSSVRLLVDLPERLPEVVVDLTRIRQVLLNLLSNAIRFTDQGSIGVSARTVEGEIEVAVSDTGVGIPADDLPTIFDEFSQARGPITSGRGGAGLGLAVCRQFVQLHGGRITVESEVGKGSVFRFTIPLPSSGRARSRLSYYSPEGWSPPLPDDVLGKSVVVLAPDEGMARAVARGVDGLRAIPLVGTQRLAEIVQLEHPLGVVLVCEPGGGEGLSPEDVWQSSGRPDLGVIEWEVPLAGATRRFLQVEAYLTKPVDIEQLVATIRSSGGSNSFLVIDDDPGFRSLIERTLRSVFQQAAIRCCADGTSALEVLGTETFDFLILDLAMPGLGGAEFLRQARERNLLAEARVIIITGATHMLGLPESLRPRISLSKRTLPKGSEWFRCISALLEAAPPDYSMHWALPEQAH